MQSQQAMEDKLIVAVCNTPIIYDRSSVLYRDRNKKELAWRRVSEEVGASVEDCRRRWKTLRDTYAKVVQKVNKRRSGSAASNGEKWKYMAVMSFLQPFLSPRETKSRKPARVVKEQAAEEEEDSSVPGPRDSVESGDGAIHADPEDIYGPLSSPASSLPYSSASSVRSGPTSTTPTGPQRKRAKSGQTDSLEPTEFEQMTVTLEAEEQHRTRTVCEDEYYLMSLLPLLKKVPAEAKDLVKFQIHKLIFENTRVGNQNNINPAISLLFLEQVSRC
ncbi:transcription factor Adf-1 [Austrofundulus limnaeus]|uniref:Transcription factor Adf-1 n=1 Tax=Austrofundulus limnaeus TaxID=52670 RepID=A0A2I4D4C9_AUSLI|nr:PREDICTED: transcription factor Adf-1-like [Austrofundulus limnaeus]